MKSPDERRAVRKARQSKTVPLWTLEQRLTIVMFLELRRKEAQAGRDGVDDGGSPMLQKWAAHTRAYWRHVIGGIDWMVSRVDESKEPDKSA